MKRDDYSDETTHELDFSSLTLTSDRVCPHCGEIADGFSHPHADDSETCAVFKSQIVTGGVAQWHGNPRDNSARRQYEKWGK